MSWIKKVGEIDKHIYDIYFQALVRKKPLFQLVLNYGGYGRTGSFMSYYCISDRKEIKNNK